MSTDPFSMHSWHVPPSLEVCHYTPYQANQTTFCPTQRLITVYVTILTLYPQIRLVAFWGAKSLMGQRAVDGHNMSLPQKLEARGGERKLAGLPVVCCWCCCCWCCCCRCCAGRCCAGCSAGARSSAAAAAGAGWSAAAAAAAALGMLLLLLCCCRRWVVCCCCWCCCCCRCCAGRCRCLVCCSCLVVPLTARRGESNRGGGGGEGGGSIRLI